MLHEPISLSGHEGRVQALAFTPDGATLVSGGAEGAVRLWRGGSLEPAGALPGDAGTVQSLAFAPDGRRVLAGSSEGSVRVWRLPSREALSSHRGYATALVSPDGKRVASLTPRGAAALWDLDSGASVAALPSPKTRVLSAVFSADGDRVLTSTQAGEVKAWKVPTGEPAGTLPLRCPPVVRLGWLPGGRMLLAACLDATLRGFEPVRWKERLRIEVPAPGAFPVAASPDGRTLALGSEHEVRLHDAGEGRLLEALEVAARGLCALAFSPDGRLLVLGASDHALRVWKVGEVTGR